MALLAFTICIYGFVLGILVCFGVYSYVRHSTYKKFFGHKKSKCSEKKTVYSKTINECLESKIPIMTNLNISIYKSKDSLWKLNGSSFYDNEGSLGVVDCNTFDLSELPSGYVLCIQPINTVWEKNK